MTRYPTTPAIRVHPEVILNLDTLDAGPWQHALTVTDDAGEVRHFTWVTRSAPRTLVLTTTSVFLEPNDGSAIDWGNDVWGDGDPYGDPE